MKSLAFGLIIASAFGLASCQPQAHQSQDTHTQPAKHTMSDPIEPITRTDAEWRELLTEEEYRVARESGTERAFTGRYWNIKTPGVYNCVGCGLALFDSDTKYDSGSGWPAYYDAINKAHIKEISDHSHGMVRTEIRCARCDTHLGHVFNDGPQPTGMRYCVNSLSLKLKPEDESPAE